MCVCVCVCVCWLLSHVWLFATPWTVACHAPLSMKFFTPEYWSRLPCPLPEPGDLPEPGMEPIAGRLYLLSHQGSLCICMCVCVCVLVVQLLSHVWLLATPWTAACQTSLSFTISRSLLKTHIHWVGDAIQPSPSLWSPSPVFNLSQYQGPF